MRKFTTDVECEVSGEWIWGMVTVCYFPFASDGISIESVKTRQGQELLPYLSDDLIEELEGKAVQDYVDYQAECHAADLYDELQSKSGRF